jgi:hypothetical protein
LCGGGSGSCTTQTSSASTTVISSTKWCAEHFCDFYDFMSAELECMARAVTFFSQHHPKLSALIDYIKVLFSRLRPVVWGA